MPEILEWLKFVMIVKMRLRTLWSNVKWFLKAKIRKRINFKYKIFFEDFVFVHLASIKNVFLLPVYLEGFIIYEFFKFMNFLSF